MSLFTDDFSSISSQKELDERIAAFPQYDPYYIASASIPDRKEIFEQMFDAFKHYCDSHFLSQIKTQFHQRTWEMYVGCSLLERNITFKSKDMGPDFFLEENGRKIWIECMACTKGRGEDKVPIMQYGTVQSIPENEMCLRLTAALQDKFRKYEEYRNAGIVSESDSFIIAINSGELGHPDGVIPLILRCVFAIGYPTISFPIGGGEPSHGWSRVYSIKKKNGSEVPMDFFLKDIHAGISGVLYCRNTVINHSNPIGEDILGISNPISKTAFPAILKRFKGYYIDAKASEWSLEPSGGAS